ncbi:GDSL-type esterase/lipase family protein [Acinetobacter sp. MF4640]|uniref:GDSL-type esterase/lipase family protein n=1 Tax=Acinetobacter sp. MF4640 TaxID=1960826 RepID=UPI000994AED9|nr:GDSL-type esterase/lipase family protein [Acinetobacter sp. MF4640]
MLKKGIIILLFFIVSCGGGYFLHDSKIDKIIKYKLGLNSKELDNYYYKLLAIQERQDLQVVPGSTIMIGDSITQGLVYPRFMNYGIGSDTTYGVINRIEKYKSLNNAKKIILMIGINDLKRRSDAEILENYLEILDKLPSSKLIVFSVLPVNEEVVSKNPQMNNARIKKINQRIAELCSQKKIKFIDLSEFYLDENGFLDKNYHVGDGIHLNQTGYDIWVKHLDQI